MVFLGQRGFRVVAHDRRSHGRSGQTWDGNTMDQYADDLAEVIERQDLKDIVLVGHFHRRRRSGPLRRAPRHGPRRQGRARGRGAALDAEDRQQPGRPSDEVFDGIRKNTLDNRAQFFKDLTVPFYGWNRDGAKPSEGLRDAFWVQGMMGGLKGQYDCIREFSEVDYSEDLRRVDVPTLIVHGNDDQIVPVGASAMLSSKIVPGATLKIYPGGDHGLAQTRQDRFNADLLAFVEG